MRDFTAQEWFTITGRGRVAVIEGLPEGDHVYDPRTFTGWRVRIDGKEYDVTGVETTLGYLPARSRKRGDGQGLGRRGVMLYEDVMSELLLVGASQR